MGAVDILEADDGIGEMTRHAVCVLNAIQDQRAQSQSRQCIGAYDVLLSRMEHLGFI